jgi:hypothetical protein
VWDFFSIQLLLFVAISTTTLRTASSIASK